MAHTTTSTLDLTKFTLAVPAVTGAPGFNQTTGIPANSYGFDGMVAEDFSTGFVYARSGGVWAQIGSHATASQAAAAVTAANAATAALTASQNYFWSFNGMAYVKVDPAGHVYSYTDAAGGLHAPALYAGSNPAVTLDPTQTAVSEAASFTFSGLSRAKVGQGGSMAEAVHPYLGPISPFSELRLKPKTWSFDATSGLSLTSDPNVLVYVPILGASLTGMRTDNVIINTTPVDPGYATMLTAGPWPHFAPSTGFTDLYETGRESMRQSLASGFAKYVNTALYNVFGTKVRIAPVIAAESGNSIVNYRPGGGIWNQFINNNELVRYFATQAGWRVVVPAFIIAHGDVDTTFTKQAFDRVLDQLQQSVSAELQKNFDLHDPVKMITFADDAYSNGSEIVAEAMLSLADHTRNPLIKCAGSMYWWDRQPESTQTLHASSLGFYNGSEMLARTFLDIAFGQTSIGPLYATGDAYMLSANTIGVPMSRPITVDDSNAVINSSGITANGGLTYSDSSGASAPAITSIAVTSSAGSVRQDVLLATLAATPTGVNKRLDWAARYNAGYGPNTGARTIIRATTPFGYSTNGGGPLYDWLVPQRVRITS